MKLRNLKHPNIFLNVVNECKGQVWLESPEGDKYNLKSIFSQYIAVGALLLERGDWLELYCSDKDDEIRFMKFFKEHPEILD